MSHVGRAARLVLVVTLAGGALAAAPEAQTPAEGVIIRERVELAPLQGVAVPDAELAACGGPLDPPCPPDPCELPGDGACDAPPIAVTAPGRVAFWLPRIATRGTPADPDYVRLDGTGGTEGVELVVEVRTAEGAVRLDTLAVEAALGLIYEQAADDGTGDLVRRYEQAEAGAPRFRTSELAPGDTLERVWTQGVGGNRVPLGHPMSMGEAGSGVMVGELFVSGPDAVVQFSDSAWGEPFTTYEGTFEPALALTATPDTLAPGGVAALTLETALPAETAVVLSLSEGAPGALAGACAGAPAAKTGASRLSVAASVGAPSSAASSASATFQTTVGAMGDCRFVADGSVAETTTATVTAELGGQALTAEVTVEAPPLVLRLLRQNDVPVPHPDAGGYLMVSKVRTDWLFPGLPDPWQSPFGQSPFSNATEDAPSDDEVYDPHTYRIEVSGFADEDAARHGADQLRFQYEVWRDGVLVAETNDLRGEGGASGVARSSSQSVGFEQETQTWSARAEAFVRLVSNGQPSTGAGPGPYDDDFRDDKSLRVELLDEVRVRASLLDEATGALTLVDELTYRVGDAPTSDGVDAVRRVDLAWQTYERADGTRLGSVPARTTERVSEDWAQASIYFEAVSDDVFTSAGVTNALQVVVTGVAPPGGGAPRTAASGTVRVRVGGQVVPLAYSADATGGDIAALLAAALQPVTGVITVGVSNGHEGAQSFGLVVAGRYGQGVALVPESDTPTDCTASIRPARSRSGSRGEPDRKLGDARRQGRGPRLGRRADRARADDRVWSVPR